MTARLNLIASVPAALLLAATTAAAQLPPTLVDTVAVVQPSIALKSAAFLDTVAVLPMVSAVVDPAAVLRTSPRPTCAMPNALPPGDGTIRVAPPPSATTYFIRVVPPLCDAGVTRVAPTGGGPPR